MVHSFLRRPERKRDTGNRVGRHEGEPRRTLDCGGQCAVVCEDAGGRIASLEADLPDVLGSSGVL